MLWGLASPFLLAGAIIASSSMRLGIPNDHKSSLLGGFVSFSSPWSSFASPWSPQQSSQKFPYSWSSSPHHLQQQQGLRRSSADLQAELLRQYFALQRLQHQDQILNHHHQQPYSRVQRSRTNEEHRQEEGDLRDSKQGEEEEEYEGRGEEEEHEDEDGDGSSEEEFDKNLSLFPGLLIDSQVGPRRMLRQKKEEETTNFIKKTLLPYPRLG